MEKNKPFFLIPIVILLLWIFQEIASRTGGFIANLFSYDRIDKYDIFAWISVHHVVQAIIALVLIAICVKVKCLDFGFGLGNVKEGLRHTLIFTIFVFIYAVATAIIGHIFGLTPAINFPLNATNVIGTLGFQLLISGTSEEILFRALPIAILAYNFKTSKDVKIHKLQIPLETIIAAVLFTIAHISWRVNPFSVNYDIIQLIISFVFGIFYGVAYQKSKSIVYPMVMHGISNFLIVGFWYILSFLFT